MEILESQNRPTRVVERPRYSGPSESDRLFKQVCQHNEASCGKGLRYLRSLLAALAANPNWAERTKQVLHVLNGSDPAAVVKTVKPWLAQQYSSPDETFIVSQVALLVKKFPFAGSKELATANGTKKFLGGERRNRHMSFLLRRRVLAGRDPEFMHCMRGFMHRLLGDAPDWKEVSKLTGWGPGANVGANGRFTNFARKVLAREWTVTPSALPYVLTAAHRSPMFWDLLGLTRVNSEMSPATCVDVAEFDARFTRRVRYVDHNNIAFVPKDADEYRTIASEPILNSWIQKGLDESIRLRLRRFGIDLRHQEPNQEKAREGSLGGYNPYTTIDLSNASGSICTELVRQLLPPDWFVALNATRSPAYRMPGDAHSTKYHGFVSMGNGFCFPLETSIFAAICQAAHNYCGTKPDFRCYGDDLIVRQNEALVVLEFLRQCGFKANSDKTFVFGEFRESCGTDWHSGVDVRPIYLDTPLETLEQRIRLHNAFTRLPNVWATVLASACTSWFPPFANKFRRPFPDDTDEAIDCRNLHWVGPWQLYEKNFHSPAWYGLSFNPVKDKEIEGHADYSSALVYGALRGSDSLVPFAARRETRVRVTRFSHSGNTSNWLPYPDAVKRYLPAAVTVLKRNG